MHHFHTIVIPSVTCVSLWRLCVTFRPPAVGDVKRSVALRHHRREGGACGLLGGAHPAVHVHGVGPPLLHPWPTHWQGDSTSPFCFEVPALFCPLSCPLPCSLAVLCLALPFPCPALLCPVPVLSLTLALSLALAQPCPALAQPCPTPCPVHACLCPCPALPHSLPCRCPNKQHCNDSCLCILVFKQAPCALSVGCVALGTNGLILLLHVLPVLEPLHQ